MIVIQKSMRFIREYDLQTNFKIKKLIKKIFVFIRFYGNMMINSYLNMNVFLVNFVLIPTAIKIIFIGIDILVEILYSNYE